MNNKLDLISKIVQKFAGKSPNGCGTDTSDNEIEILN
jgi:hypothetical protein